MRRPSVVDLMLLGTVLLWSLNVTVTKEIKGADGQWTAAPVAAQTEADLENAILTKARQLNLSNAG